MLSSLRKTVLNSFFSRETPMLDHSYREYNTSRALDSSLVHVILVLTQQAALIGISAVYYESEIIIRQAIVFAIVLLFALLRKRMLKYNEFMLFLLSSTVYINSMLILRGEFEELTNRSIYIQSYLLGVFHQLLIVLMLRFHFAILFHLIISGTQCFVSITIGYGGYYELVLEIAIPIFLSLILFGIMTNFERDDKKMFKRTQKNKVYSYIKKPNLEALLIKFMPQSVLLVTEELNSILFANESFIRNFSAPDTLNLSLDVLESFIVRKDHFNIEEKFGKLFEDEETLDLQTLLEKSLIEKYLSAQESCFTIFASSTYHKDKLFEVTIFKTVQDRENAIGIIINDITLQKTCISIKAADASKDQLLATISHELKTPLNGVLGGLNTALETVKDAETLSFLTMSKRSAKLLIATVNSLLDLHNMRKNTLKLRMTRIKLKSMLEEVESLFESQCNQKGLKLATKLQPKVPDFINTDKDRLSQILINLLTNAIKFTQSGEVTLQISLDPNAKENILFEVIDTGVGIKPEDQSQISSRMYGNENKDGAVGVHGVGLGLTVSNYLAKRLNKNNEGVKCVSEHTKGSIFSFSISPDLSVSSMKDRRKSADCDIIKILENVDDDDDDQHVDIKMDHYGERKESPSRNFEFSRQSISISPCLNDQDEFFQTDRGACPLIKGLPALTGIPRSKTDTALLTPFNRKESTEKNIIYRKISTPTSSRVQLIPSKGDILENEHLKGWVLLVDDNPFNLMVARKVVEKMGYSVKTADDGEDAVAKVKGQIQDENEFFKLILMDCQMPIMDGYQATREIRMLMQNEKVPTCPIVALTANDTEEDKKKCIESGMDEVLSKPLLEDDIKKIQVYL